MSWLRLDDSLELHPKILELSEVERWRWICVLLSCARHETDGLVRPGVLRRIGIKPDRLVDVGLLEVVDNSYWVRDYLDFNPSREEKERERERWRQYKRSSRKGENVHGGHSRDSRGSHASFPRSPSPSPSSKGETSSQDVAKAGEGLNPGIELLAARLLEAAGELDESGRDFIRGAALRLPEAVSARVLEGVAGGRARDRAAYIIGALRRELELLEGAA